MAHKSDKPDNPYRDLPPSAFWRTGVAEAGLFGYRNLWSSAWKLPKDARFSTFGSCFAQHISRALLSREMNWFNGEPAPGKTPDHIASKYNYGVFSARTGNIYTAAQLLVWVELAAGLRDAASVEYWEDGNGRWHDMLRPRIEPNGFISKEEAQASVASTARSFARCITQSDVFVFTLGLTEGWINSKTGQTYSICPGTGIGTFDPDAHQFHNYTYPEILEGLTKAFETMRGLNADLRVLLTVSPVPLVATASGDHVLVATQYSKSVLRAVAGHLAQTDDTVDYFPSYEIIAAPPTRAAFFEPNMRSIAPQGVELVMKHFFSGLDLSGSARHSSEKDAVAEAQAASERELSQEELVCEEMILDKFNER
ncbi:GSCFA domain-containing protein [Celeribacter litoreus]|uniref:GSCFA domain-containing protein n=1 Tax=Celeribacter litoreus TaxID=2876714 RepID=UPI001CC9000D|nr:GSCFA domain-containing protein [Celeribacter litoreus]MCA0045125.1 GSCFA domain-containing protein [Celeribacter litoreus]